MLPALDARIKRKCQKENSSEIAKWTALDGSMQYSTHVLMGACKFPMKLFSYVSLDLLNAFHRFSRLRKNKRYSFLPL